MATLLDSELPARAKTVGRKIDPAEAYIDMIVVEEAGGAGDVQVCVDGLSIDGIVFAKDNQSKTRHAKFDETKDLIGPTASECESGGESARTTSSEERQLAFLSWMVDRNSFGRLNTLANRSNTSSRLDLMQSSCASRRRCSKIRKRCDLGIWLIAPARF